jgi:hypothetical protein
LTLKNGDPQLGHRIIWVYFDVSYLTPTWVVLYLKESYPWSTITQTPLIASASYSEIPLQFLVTTM